MKANLKFRDLQVGDVFEFEGTGLGLARGPWEKVSARGYILEGKPKQRYNVGSISVKVTIIRKGGDR